jgi:hypothetical protein
MLAAGVAFAAGAGLGLGGAEGVSDALVGGAGHVGGMGVALEDAATVLVRPIWN